MIGVRQAFAVLAVCASLGAALAAQPAMAMPGDATACHAQELPAPAGMTSAWVNGGDPTGRWLAGGAGTLNTSVPVVWHRGQPTALTVPAPAAGAYGINRRGDVVGAGSDGGQPVVFAVKDGQYIELGVPAGTQNAGPTGISTAGLVSGWLLGRDGLDRAVVWDLARPAEPRLLPVPGLFSRTVGISARGTVAVTSESAEGVTRSYLFTPAGHRTELHGLSDHSVIQVQAIANGWAAGTEYLPTGRSHLVRYDLAAGTIERFTIPSFEFSMELNRDGIVAGRDLHGGVLYTDHVVQLPAPDGAIDAGLVTTIDNDGDPAGTVSVTSRSVAAVQWRCSP